MSEPTDQHARIPRPLRHFAYRVAGPREFVITGAINAVIAALVYRHVNQIPLVGGHSLLIMFGPMCFFLPLLTTYFAYLCTVMERKRGRVAPSWQSGCSWSGAAIRAGLVRGVIGCACGCLAVLAVDQLAPDVLLPKWPTVAGIGLVAGMLGFWLHSSAVIRAGNVGLMRVAQTCSRRGGASPRRN